MPTFGREVVLCSCRVQIPQAVFGSDHCTCRRKHMKSLEYTIIYSNYVDFREDNC